jgi:hypothetical protein
MSHLVQCLTLCLKDLDPGSKMIIFESILEAAGAVAKLA